MNGIKRGDYYYIDSEPQKGNMLYYNGSELIIKQDWTDGRQFLGEFISVSNVINPVNGDSIVILQDAGTDKIGNKMLYNGVMWKNITMIDTID